MNSNTNINKRTLPVKSEKINSIVRVVHNRENPYVMLNKKTLWDENLSLKAIGLWTRCLSRPDDWIFSINELVKSCKEGRRAIDGAMQELIEARLVCRLEYYEREENGKFKKGCGGVQYIFFEFPATEEEIAEQLEIFKKSFRLCGFGDSRNGDSRNVHLLNIDNNKIQKKPIESLSDKSDEKKEDFSKKVKKKEEFSEAVKDTMTRIIGAMKLIKQDYKPVSNDVALLTQTSYLIDKDGRNPEKILSVLLWALGDDFWSAKMFKRNPVEFLRKHFDSLEMQLMSKSKDSKKVDRRLRDKDGMPIKDEFKDNLF